MNAPREDDEEEYDREYLRRTLMEAFEPKTAEDQIFILATRVSVLTREKESLERRMLALENKVTIMRRALDRGTGVLMVLPILGALIGVLLAYGRAIFRPWVGQ